MRIYYGLGYRVYFKQLEQTIILLLAGGVKNSQNRDISIANNL